MAQEFNKKYNSFEELGKSKGLKPPRPKNKGGGRKSNPEIIPINLIFNRKSEDDNRFIDEVKSYAKNNQKAITTSQLRNIFSKIKPIKSYEENKTKINLLRVKFAYISGRSGKSGMEKLCEFLDMLISEIQNDTNWDEFKDFFEALIAYHKFFGGNKNG